jgi:hypothetical protein
MARTRFYAPDIARFSRRWWLQAGKNLFWIAIVTMLIWVYADLEFTDTVELRATLRLTAAESNELALLDSRDITSRDVELTVELQGARHALTTYEQALRDADGVVTYDVTKTHGPGRHDVGVVALLNRTAGVAQAGLRVLSAKPAVVAVELDRTERLEDVPVRLRATGATIADANVTPPAVDAYICRTHLEQIRRQANAELALHTEVVNLQSAPAGAMTVAIEPFIDDRPVRLERPTVRVDVTFSELTAEKTLSVSVRLLVPAAWAHDGTWQRFALERKEPANWVQRITVRGPKKDIDRLQPQEIDAYVVLTDRHKRTPESWDTEDVQIRFPAGTDFDLVGKPPGVSFRLNAIAGGLP